MTGEAAKLSFGDLLAKLQPNFFPGVLICLDPGETTGYAVFRKGQLLDMGQLATKTIPEGARAINGLFDTYRSGVMPLHIVMEDYRIYGWKTEEHTWAGLHTPKLIGGVITICTLGSIGYTLQMAQQAKGFCTDEKLQTWDFYIKGQKHARDAIRHGAYYLLFDKNHPHVK